MNKNRILCIAVGVAGLAICEAQGEGPRIGFFDGHRDVGTVLHEGSVEYDAGARAYTVTGSGANIWATEDDFQFVWKKMSDENITLAADISILSNGGDNHRKGVLMMRQSLDADSAYADIARHGDGLTSLQFRDAKGGGTHEIESSVSAPQRLRLDKRGDQFYMWIGNDQRMEFAGGSARVPLKAPFYVGIGVSAHNKDAVQKMVFTNVGLTTMQNRPNQAADLYSTLETIAVSSTDARVSYVAHDHIETPSWSSDGDFLLFRAGNQTQRVSVKGGIPERSEAGGEDRQQIPQDATNSGARLSPDGKQIAFISSADDPTGQAVLSVMSVADHSTRVLAKLQGGLGSLSAHPWSPDGKRLAFISYQSIQ